MSVIVSNSKSKDRIANTTCPSNVAQYEVNCENQVTKMAKDDYEEKPYNVALYQERYWEPRELSKKKNVFKNKSASGYKETDDNFITYRKTNLKDQKENHKVYKLDKTTTLLIEKLINVKNISPYHNAIGKGRNSIVIVVGETDVKTTPSCHYSYKNAIKIYKLTNDDAKNKAIFQRTQREANNIWLGTTPVRCCKNIIVMQHIGTDEEPALPITMVPKDLCKTYHQLISKMSHFYSWNRGVVHGNLNGRNILCWQEYPYIIGWSHSVHADHPDALKKLMKDCCFVTKFFRRKGVTVKSIEMLYKHITKVENISSEVLDIMDRYKNRSKIATPNHRYQGRSRFNGVFFCNK